MTQQQQQQQQQRGQRGPCLVCVVVVERGAYVHPYSRAVRSLEPAAAAIILAGWLVATNKPEESAAAYSRFSRTTVLTYLPAAVFSRGCCCGSKARLRRAGRPDQAGVDGPHLHG